MKSHWEHQLFQVVKQQGELPVFQVKSLDNQRDVRVLHRNHLMKCEELPVDVFKEFGKVEEPKTKKKKAANSKPKVVEVNSGEESEEDEIVVAVYADEGNLQAEREPDIALEVSELPERIGLDPLALEWNPMVPGEEGQEALVHVDVEPLDYSDSLPAEEREVIEDAEMELLSEDSGGAQEGNSSGDTEDEETDERPVQRVRRERKPTKIYTYEKLGGDPSFAAQGQKKRERKKVGIT